MYPFAVCGANVRGIVFRRRAHWNWFTGSRNPISLFIALFAQRRALLRLYIASQLPRQHTHRECHSNLRERAVHSVIHILHVAEMPSFSFISGFSTLQTNWMYLFYNYLTCLSCHAQKCDSVVNFDCNFIITFISLSICLKKKKLSSVFAVRPYYQHFEHLNIYTGIAKVSVACGVGVHCVVGVVIVFSIAHCARQSPFD